MTEQPAGPRCGNNPNFRMSDGDRKAVDDFRAHLALAAAAKPYIDAAVWVDGDPLMEVIAATLWKHCARDDEDMPQAVCDDPRTIAALAAAVARAQEPAVSSAAATPPTASTSPLAVGLPLVKGRCPACGTAGLFLGDGGYVTCSLIGCPEPDAASSVLERRADTPPADRAAVLAEAIAAIEVERDATDVNVAEYPRYDWKERAALEGALRALRRLAAEAPEPATQAEAELPPTVEYRVETRMGGTWTTLGAPLDVGIARKIYADYRRGYPEAEMRLLRCTRTTVVIEHQPGTETQDAPPAEPHPTEADLRHALTVAAKFHGQAAAVPAVGQTGEEA